MLPNGPSAPDNVFLSGVFVLLEALFGLRKAFVCAEGDAAKSCRQQQVILSWAFPPTERSEISTGDRRVFTSRQDHLTLIPGASDDV